MTGRPEPPVTTLSSSAKFERLSYLDYLSYLAAFLLMFHLNVYAASFQMKPEILAQSSHTKKASTLLYTQALCVLQNSND